jgi:DNA-binding NtrC family response regulator
MRLPSSIRRGSSEEDRLVVMESQAVKRRVLVVDDAYDHRLILCHRLTSMGFDVIGEDNGASALARIAFEVDRMPVSGMLLELRMSIEDGMAVLQKMRDRYPQIPVIAMSNSLNVALLRESVRRGASEYVVKPFDVELLRRKCLRVFVGGDQVAEESMRH